MMTRLSEESLQRFEKTWQEYLTDDSYNDIGKLNLVAWLGERAGAMLSEIRALQAEAQEAKQLLDEKRQKEGE
jgi:hypothetical protein